MTFLLKISFVLFGGGLLGIVSFTPSPNFSESYNNWLSSLHELASLMIAAGLLSFTFWCVERLIFAKPIEDSKLKSNKYEKRAEEYFKNKNKVKQ
ncbi:MAG TPA: hypothetical protein VJJ25_04460 [Nitrosopumilaceae archaeon]|nr:hypothetical protein [Nitrosopumilaceae archaeon]